MSRAAWILLLLALAARLLLVFNTKSQQLSGPVPEFNDEAAHLNYVRFVSEWGRLPVQTVSVQEGFEQGEFEYYQAPLYYLLARPFYSIGHKFSPGAEVYWVRLASVIFSTAGLYVLYLSAKVFFSNGSVPLSILLLGAFGGIPLRFGYVVTNDSLLFLCCCLYFALLLEILRGGCDSRLLIAGILTAAAGLWTKASFLLILPLFPIVLAFNSPRARWKRILALILPLLAIFPWYLRNYLLYGNWLPITTGFGTPDLLSADNFASRIYILANYFVRSLVFPYDEFWGGWPDKLIYPFEGLFFLLLLIVGYIAVFHQNRRIARIIAAALMLNLTSYLYLNFHYSQAEARYFLPALPFVLTLLAWGAAHLCRIHRSCALGLIALWIILPWLTILW